MAQTVYSQKDLLTRRDQAVAFAKDHISMLQKDILTDDLLLLEVIAGGEQRWRTMFLKEFAGLPVDDEIPQMLWRLFMQEFTRHFGTATPAAVLDSVYIPSPVTEREIEDSWEHESSSSDDARRYFGVT